MSTSEQMSASDEQSAVTRRDPLADEPGTERPGTDQYSERPAGEPEFAEPGRSGPVVEDPMLSTRDDTDRYDSVRDDTVRGDSVRGDSVRDDTVRGDTVREDSVREDSVREDSVRGDTVRDDFGRHDSVRDTGRDEAVLGEPAAGTARTDRASMEPGEAGDYPAAGETAAVDAGGAAPATAGTGRESQPHTEAAPPAGSVADDDSDRTPLVASDRAQQFATRWNEVKGMFVDEPRQAVQQADALVGELLEDLQRSFSEQRHGIEHGLDTDDTSTEDLRTALRRYRSFFDRLLSV